MDGRGVGAAVRCGGHGPSARVLVVSDCIPIASLELPYHRSNFSMAVLGAAFDRNERATCDKSQQMLITDCHEAVPTRFVSRPRKHATVHERHSQGNVLTRHRHATVCLSRPS